MSNICFVNVRGIDLATAGKRFYYKQNRLKQLRAFCYAARLNSISKAADELCLSQPSVSLQVRALERELGLTLFERRGPRIELTPEGHVLHEIAAPLVEGIDTLPETIAARCSDTESGELDVAAGESTILYLLPEFLQRFAERYPGIRLRLHNVTGRDGLALLRADDVDFAVGSMLEPEDDISYQPIFSYDPVVITPLDHPLLKKESLTLEDISPYGLILPPRHLSTWRAVDLVFQGQGVKFRVALEMGGWEVIKKYVELGLGISIVTSICLTGTEKLAVLPIGKYFPKRTYGVVQRRGKFLSPAAKRFIETMDPSYFAREPGVGEARPVVR